MSATAFDLEHIFGLPQNDKAARLLEGLLELTEHHRARCHPYRELLEALSWSGAVQLDDLPWLPVRLFKEHVLRSIPADQVFRRLTSSGTTGGGVSMIDLDAEAAQYQSKALARTLQTVLGPSRLPMLIIDSRAVTRGSSFSARGAGVLGMMSFGRQHVFALDDQMQLDHDAIHRFLDRFGGEPFLIFGFTFMVWQYLSKVSAQAKIDLSNGVLIHSGGWKKLVDQAVSPSDFRATLTATTGLHKITNYYGMVEQIGTVFLESPEGDGSLTCPSFADVIIRDPLTFEPVPHGETGLIQTLSLLPTSYPGHSVLTEDLGRIVGVDDTERNGHRFVVLGRLPRAEARGCSDTFVAN
jgi:hypothetical protein